MFKATKRKIEPGANKTVQHRIQSVVDPGFYTGGGGTKIIFCGRQKLENKEKKVIKIPSKPHLN